jgi:four helix bundle protein
MRDQDEERSTRYPGRNDRGRGSFTGGSRDREWKGQRENTSDRPREAEGRGAERGAPAGRQSSGNRPRVEEMDVFRLAHDLAARAYELSARFPPEERNGLAALLQRASAAVPAQLAAGSSRWDRAEYRAGVTDARDAAAEARYFLLLAKELGHLSAEDCTDMREGYERVARMLSALAKALG